MQMPRIPFPAAHKWVGEGVGCVGELEVIRYGVGDWILAFPTFPVPSYGHLSRYEFSGVWLGSAYIARHQRTGDCKGRNVLLQS